MGDTAGNVKANHVSFGVDPRGCGAREVAGGESALVEHQAVLDASCNVRAGDIALGVDTGSQQFRMRQARRWPALWLCRSVEARRGASVPVARLTGCRMGDTFISACSPSRFPAPARHESSRYAPAKCSRNATLRNPALNPRPSGPVPRVAPDRAIGHSAGSGPHHFRLRQDRHRQQPVSDSRGVGHLARRCCAQYERKKARRGRPKRWRTRRRQPTSKSQTSRKT